jgi:hypothetical protein
MTPTGNDPQAAPGNANVVSMEAFQKAKDQLSPQESKQILGETRDMVLQRLTASLTSSLDKIEDELFELAEKSTDRELQNSYLDARVQAKARRADIEATFKRNFVELFNGKASGQVSEKKKEEVSLSGLELSLVDESDLESSLAVKELARKLKSVLEAELGPLGQRVGLLLNKEELEADDNPVSPDTVARALKEAIQLMDVSPKVRLYLMKMFEQLLAPEMKRMYGDINAHLVRRQILPQLRVGYRRPVAIGGAARPGVTAGAAETPAAMAQAEMQGVMDGTPADAPQDMFSMLQSLMMGAAGAPVMGVPGVPVGPVAGAMGIPGGLPLPAGMGGVGMPGAMPPGGGAMGYVGPQGGGAGYGPPGMPIGSAGGFVSALSGLQAGTNLDFWAGAGLDPALLMGGGGFGVPMEGAAADGASVAGGYAAPAVYAPPVNVIRQIRQSQVGKEVNQTDGVTIDIVAMIFDYVFEDKEIQAPVKSLVSKLQIPILKVALIDKSFFTKKDHPVRLYLDRVAQISIGCPPNVSRDDELFKRIDQTVSTVTNEFESDLDLFTRELHALERFYEDYQQRAHEREQESAKLAEESAHRESIKYAIEVEVATRSTAPGVPMIAQALMSEVLPVLLQRAVDASGIGGADWEAAIVLTEDLVWSVQPKAGSEDRKKLVQLLPGLLKRLRAGMKDAGLDAQKSDAYIRSLAGLHAAAVKNEETAPPPPPAPKYVEAPMDIDLTQFQPEVKSSKVEGSSGLAVEEIRLVKQSRELKQALDQFDEYDAMVKTLARGTWVDFKRSDGTFLRVKLTFVSAEYGVYVFTNPQLASALSVSREALAVQLKMGDAVIVPEKSMFDRALGGLISKLKPAGKA